MSCTEFYTECNVTQCVHYTVCATLCPHVSSVPRYTMRMGHCARDNSMSHCVQRPAVHNVLRPRQLYVPLCPTSRGTQCIAPETILCPTVSDVPRYTMYCARDNSMSHCVQRPEVHNVLRPRQLYVPLCPTCRGTQCVWGYCARDNSMSHCVRRPAVHNACMLHRVQDILCLPLCQCSNLSRHKECILFCV